MDMHFRLSFFHPKYFKIWLLLLLLCLIARLPTSARHYLAKILGSFSYTYNHKRRNIIKNNLSYCFPEFNEAKIDAVCQESMFYLTLGVVEYSVVIFAGRKRLKQIVQVENIAAFETLAAEKKGVLLMVAHTPFIEFFGCALEGYGYGEYFKKHKNELMNYVVMKARKKFVPLLVSREDGLGKVVSALKNRHMFYYPADEDLGLNYSQFAPFFAGNKATLTTAARISKVSRCVCMPVITVWDKTSKKYTVKSLPVLENYPSEDAYQNACQLNQALEKLIEQNLSQYMWSFKLFRTRRKGDLQIY